jgi:hypothetical protein
LIEGGLFTRDFLLEGIREQDAWKALDDDSIAGVREDALSLFGKLLKTKHPSEPVTEKDLIYPLLRAIGWGDLVYVQPNLSAKGRADVPDALLFADDESNDRGRREKDDWKRFRHGICIVEAKRWARVLDREDNRAKGEEGVPSTQMLRYLRRVDDVTQGRLRWGILTNGRHWRLYWQSALSVAEDFLEIDLGKVLDLPGCELDLIDRAGASPAEVAARREHAFKLFLILFSRGAFLPLDHGKSFHDVAIAEGKFWEERVARDLSNVVFDKVFPDLADALAKADPERDPALGPAYLDDLRQAALILLYRLLFVLYAEDRNLLPDESGPYVDYCLRRVRLEVADRKASGRAFPASFVTIWPKLTSIFRAISQGDDTLGIPPYNGGLFDPVSAPILERVQLPDAVVADVVFALSHINNVKNGRGPKYINYRDLSVQQLGSVYERILEHGLRAAPGGNVEIAADDQARHSSGSYYTPDSLVALIIERAVGPLVEERLDAFRNAAKRLASDKRAAKARLADLAELDPATRMLDLKVCDPAMGSGHFLVNLVDWLADHVLAAMAEATALVQWTTYTSPLAERIAAVRTRISSEATKHGWPLVEGQLDDRHVVRRMVLKRVVYGLDKNPMAVELSKVALWLHSFTVGAPLSFLDHHLRCGDSILGAWVRPTVDALQARGALFNLNQIARVEHVAGVMAEIEQTTDNDVAEVTASKEKFGVVEEATAPVASLFSLLTAERVLGIFDKAPKAPPDLRKLAGKSEKQVAKARTDLRAFERAAALQLVLEGTFGDPIRIANGDERVATAELANQLSLILDDTPPEQEGLFPSLRLDDRRRLTADQVVGEARALSARDRFFHWEIGFPNVWTNLMSGEPQGGFDAAIGNPPYVRQELLGEIKPALKKAYGVFDGVADLYVYFYEQGLRLLRPGGRMSYVVTNKWLKAAYAEGLRDLLGKAWPEFVSDFGHAKHFFPDVDVFPSVIAVRKPNDTPAPKNVDVCVIPRDAVPEKGLSNAVAAATFSLPRVSLTKESWILEPKPVMDLLEKIRRNGVPLAEYAGVKPYRGVLTGLNEAFLIDTATRDQLVSEHPACAAIIKPYLRGQDIERWYAPWTGLWMIFTRRGIEIERYPSVLQHLESHRSRLEPKPEGWKPQGVGDEWPGRKPGMYAWYEIQDAVDYWPLLEKPKILYPDITWTASFALDFSGLFTSNTGYFIPTGDPWIAAVLNAPVGWWFAWRNAQHGKDEALRYFNTFLDEYPIASGKKTDVSQMVSDLTSKATTIRRASEQIRDWLRVEFAFDKPGALAAPHTLEVDGFIAVVRKALPKSRKLSVAEVTRLRQEYKTTIEPARHATAEALVLERRLSDLVNAAYGLTPDEVKLMWDTAPPRMPFGPPLGDSLAR